MKLDDYLYKHRLTQEKFAKMVGISHRTFIRIRDGYDLKLTTAIKIVKATNGEVSYEDLANEHTEGSNN